MPARRGNLRLAPPRITPLDLQGADRSPYVVTEMLAELARRVHADVVLIDLRVGITELSAPVLLDPRVHRVFVSTPSDQSVRGTRRILDELGRRAPATRPGDAPATLILTQFSGHDRRPAVQELRDAAARLAGDRVNQVEQFGATDAYVMSEPIFSQFRSELRDLPATLTGVWEAVASTGLGDDVRPLVDLLAPTRPRPLADGFHDTAGGLDDIRE
jgi:hypothetical protein